MRFGRLRLDQAQGAILAHSHGPSGLRKGRVLTTEDIAALAATGVTEITAAQLDPGDLDENTAAAGLAAALVPDPAGQALALTPAFTGRVNLNAIGPGVVRLDARAIHALNRVDPGITLATLPDLADRLVMMTATTKTFNIAGAHSGNVIIADPALRARFAERMNAMGISPNSFGLFMATAAYSPEGAAWVDFAGTGMTQAEFIDRVQKAAKIAANHGTPFGAGGESFLRFNLATPRAVVVEAVKRLQTAFADLQ